MLKLILATVVTTVVLALAATGAFASEGVLKGPEILDLTDGNFESTTQASTGMTSMPSVFVVLYAKWCGHCQSLLKEGGEIDKLGDLFSAHSTRVVRVDCDSSPSTCRRFGVKAYPTMVLLKSGKMYRYKSARSSSSMTAFAQSPTVDPEEIPAPLTWVDELQWWGQIIVDDFAKLHETNPTMLMGMLGALFIVFLCILVLAVSSPAAPPAVRAPAGGARPSKGGAKPAPKQARPSAPAENKKTQ